MNLIALTMAGSAVLLSIAAIFSYGWVTFLPRLGIATLYHLRTVRIVVAIFSILLAFVAWRLVPSNSQLALLLVVIGLTPLSGFTYAGKVLVAVDSPAHVQPAHVLMADDAMVLGIDLDGAAHAWAVETLVPHHLVNDEIDRRPVVATW